MVGQVLSGTLGIENTSAELFPCLTTVPLRVTLGGTNKEYVQAVHNSAMSVLEYQHTPYNIIARASETRTMLFDTLFLYQKQMRSVDQANTWKRVLDCGTTEVI